MAKMNTEEAFVKVLQMHGIKHAFGIIGSAFMPISDLFPKAGITFWDVAHESNGGLIADGYTRSTGMPDEVSNTSRRSGCFSMLGRRVSFSQRSFCLSRCVFMLQFARQK